MLWGRPRLRALLSVFFCLCWLVAAPLRGDEATPAATTSVAAAKTGLAAITVPAGFTVELAAEAPLVERPMLATFDDEGRLYVCDSAGVNLRGPELSKNPPHVIRRLEDTDGDGRFDKSVVFADMLVFPQGIAWHDGAIYCSSPPSFWKFTDTNGDGQADQREELSTGYANTGVADDMHGGSLGPDGRLYWCAGRFPHKIRRPDGPIIHQGTAPLILRCRPDGSDLEAVCGSQGNAVGVAFTPEGDMFASGTFLAPNSMGAGLRDALVHCVDGAEYPVRDRTPNEHKRTGDMLPPLTHLGVSASSDLMICRGNALGEAYRGNLLSALFNMHKIVHHKITRDGATFTCRNEDFLVSSDPDFHPTDVFQDADGSVLVIDTGGWFRIGCPTSQVAKPEVLGAIYRVSRKGIQAPVDPRGLRIDWAKSANGETVALLGDPRTAVSDRAISELAKRGAAAVPAIEQFLKAQQPVEAHCAAVWALSRNSDASARSAIRGALKHPQAGVRQAAARAAGLERDTAASERLMAIVRTDEPAVRREAATALGRIGQSSSVPALLDGLNAVSDRFLEHALIFALIQINDPGATTHGLAAKDSSVNRGTLIALDQMESGSLTPDVLLPYLSLSDPLLQQTALWVIGNHADWGPALIPFFTQWIARQDLDDAQREALRRQLLAFVGNPEVQKLIGDAVLSSGTPLETRLLLLETMAQSTSEKLPVAWVAGLQQALADKDERVLRQTVATLRALPFDKRPIVTRVEPQVNFPMTRDHFAGTRLAQNFCVRFSGIVRCEKAGKYTFYTDSDDGSQLFIDGKLVVNNGGSHALREKSGTAKLAAGDHTLRLDFVQEAGEAACILSWAMGDQPKAAIPASSLFHRQHGKAAGQPQPGLLAEFYEVGGRTETFPDMAAAEFDESLVRVATDATRPIDIRVQAAAAVVQRLPTIESELFDFLTGSVQDNQPPLVRLDAAEALGKCRLDDAQLKALTAIVAEAGVLEISKLLPAFEQSTDTGVGEQLVVALSRSPGLSTLSADAIASIFAGYPEAIREQAAPLVKLRTVDLTTQKARLASLHDVLTGGEIQRGRDLFFGNKKAICATCHAVQAQGGKIGPDLSKIGAIRTPRDLLEAIVLPSASFARGYEPFTLVTHNGQVQAGIIARETADAIYLLGNNRIEVRVPRAEIDTLQQSQVSIMPEGMDAQLSRQELADLIAFLQSLQ